MSDPNRLTSRGDIASALDKQGLIRSPPRRPLRDFADPISDCDREDFGRMLGCSERQRPLSVCKDRRDRAALLEGVPRRPPSHQS